MVMMLMLIVVIFIFVMMVMMLMLIVVIFIFVMMVVMLMLVLIVLLGGKAGQLCLQRVAALHCLAQLVAGQLVPRCGDNDSRSIVCAEQFDRFLDLLGGRGIGVADDNATGVFNLVIEEFAEVFHVHLALAGIHHGGKAVQYGALGGCALHGADDVGQLADAGRLDQDTVGVVLADDLRQRLAEVADQGAADAPGVHLVDPDACVGKEAAVNADLAELVLDEHQLLALVGVRDELLDQRGFACAEEAGENVDFCHGISLLSLFRGTPWRSPGVPDRWGSP